MMNTMAQAQLNMTPVGRAATRPYQICTRCIMDTSDPDICFDDYGICNHCKIIIEDRDRYWLPDARGAQKLAALIADIKRAGRGRPYDCIMGLSGGVDSSYLAVKAQEWGLRVLAVHVDAGWNSELAVQNIERIVTKLGIDLHTIVIDWEEMRDLQVAFLKAGVPNQDIPQDHAFFAALYRETVRQNIPYVLHGGNHATESILPAAWGYSAMDWTHIAAIHRRFGMRRLRRFPHVGFFYFNYFLQRIKGVKIAQPLDWMPYSKAMAMAELQEKFGWQYYGGKHYESRFTKFFQAYYLPTRFGYDKKRAHVASLVAAGEMTRAQGLDEMARPLYEPQELARDRAFVMMKLGLDAAEFEALLTQPLRQHRVFPTQEWLRELRAAGSWPARARLLARHIIAKTTRRAA